MSAITEPKYLNAAAVISIVHDDVSVAVDGDARGSAEIIIADGADVGTIGVIQNVHTRATTISHNQMTGAVQCDTLRTGKAVAAGAL